MQFINLAILKLFIDSRNSVTIKQRKNLGIILNASLNLNDKFQSISQHNEKMETDSMTLIHTQISTCFPQDMSSTNVAMVMKQQE